MLSNRWPLLLSCCCALAHADETPKPELRTGDTWVYAQTSTAPSAARTTLRAEFTVGWLSEGHDWIVLLRRASSAGPHQIHGQVPEGQCVVDVTVPEALFRKRSCSAPLVPGEAWSAETESTRSITLNRYRYEGREEITTAAGTFNALKFSGERIERPKGIDAATPRAPATASEKRYATVWWYAPQVHGMVRVVRTMADAANGGTVDQIEELESYAAK